MHITPPEIGLLRELSPEISPEERAMLTLGDPPQSLRPQAHPLAVLLRERWKQRNCDRRLAAREICGSAGYAKTIRRIDELLAGERYLPEWLDKLTRYLEISADELEQNRLDVIAWEKAQEAFDRRRSRHALYARFGPYLIPLPPEQAVPLEKPVSRDLRVEDLYEVHGDPAPEDLSSWIKELADHFIHGKWTIAGWLYLRHPEELHFFSVDGCMIVSGGADLPRPAAMVVPYVPLWRSR